MHISIQRIACLLLAVGLVAGVMLVPTPGWSQETIYTKTGNISMIKGAVITLVGGTVLTPFNEVDIPKWAIPGAPASFSYVVRPTGYFYLEIVKPGEKLKEKEKLEWIWKQKN